MRRFLLAGLLGACAAWAQNVVAVKAGLVQYVEGDVYLDDARVEKMKAEELFARPPQMKNESLLRTVDGRAEVLLSPGLILRLGPGSVIRMVSNSLTDTRVELQRGAVVLEAMERTKDNVVTLLYKDIRFSPRKEGLYRFGGPIPELMVYDGQAELIANDKRLSVKRGRSVLLEEPGIERKFDASKGDPLMAWSVSRGTVLSLASRSVVGGMMSRRNSWASGGWFWNPSFGLYTFIPYRGQYCGIFGYCFYTPDAYYSAFVMPRIYPQPQQSAGSAWDRSGYSSAGGYQTQSQRTYDSSPPVAAPAASAPAPSVRGGESSAGRGGEGGGRSQ